VKRGEGLDEGRGKVKRGGLHLGDEEYKFGSVKKKSRPTKEDLRGALKEGTGGQLLEETGSNGV